MNRYLRTSFIAATAGAVLMFAAYGCALNPFAGYTFDELAGAGSSGGAGGAGGTGGMACICYDDQNVCTDDDHIGQECPGGDDKACHTPVANSDCTQENGSPGFCGANGVCNSCQECADAACVKRCNGQVCNNESVCESGNCVDGYCCDSKCTGPCNACNRVPGTCSQLPVGMRGGCSSTKLCNNAAACDYTTKKSLGSLLLCNADSECASGACWAQSCVSKNGQPCVEDLECASNLCDPTTHVCVSCEDGVSCPDGASCLTGGRCQVFPGQPAEKYECVPPGDVHDQMTCTLPIDAECTFDIECIYHHCKGETPNGKCANACTNVSCPLGFTCNANGQCRLPKGSYCVIDDQCQGPVNAGKCSGFPRKCQ